MIVQDEFIDLETASGKMRTYLYRPLADGRYPSIIFFSEIFQQTEPIRRTASILAGHGFNVVVPEIFHELNPIGTVLGYDDSGKEKGNSDKIAKTIDSYDNDVKHLVSFLNALPSSTGKIGAMGICIGGHLAFRAAMHPSVLAASCLYATDIHSSTLGYGQKDDSLARCSEIKGELQMVWGKQDPHIPTEGRQLIYQKLTDAGVCFTWQEFNAQHAFMRDEGHRYDPALALTCYQQAVGLFQRTLHGDSISHELTSKQIDSSC